MKCLWLTRQYPLPPDSGELIYSLGLVKSLAAQAVDVTLLCYARARDRAPTPVVEPFAEVQLAGAMPPRGVGSLLSYLPSDAYRMAQGRLAETLQHHLQRERYDALIIEQAAMGWGLRQWRQLPKVDRPALVYISHNREAEIRPQIARDCRENWAKRKLMQFDARKYAHLEQAVCRESCLISAITPADARAYAREYPQARIIELLPGYQAPDSPAGQEMTAATPKRVLLVGSFEWIAKRQNLERFLAAAVDRFARDQIEIQVVGKASPEFVQQTKKRFPTIDFQANVPSIAPFLTQARVGLIAETVGGGFKLKTLDYVFHGLPVAALQQALGGVELTPDVHAMVANHVEELVEQIAQRIDDLPFLNRMARAAREHLADRFRWEDRGATLLAALEAVRGAAPQAVLPPAS